MACLINTYYCVACHLKDYAIRVIVRRLCDRVLIKDDVMESRAISEDRVTHENKT